MGKRWIDMNSEEKSRHKIACRLNRDRIDERSKIRAYSRQIEADAEYSLAFMEVCKRYVIPEKLA